MTHLRAELAAAWSIVEREARIFVSYRARAVSRLATIALSLVLFYYISKLVHVSRFASPGAYFAFVVGGLVVLEIIASTFQMPTQLYGEMLSGTFERIAISPFGALASIVSMTVFPVTLTLIYGFATLLIASGGFGMPLHWTTLPLALPVAILAAASFMPFSLVFASMAVAFKQQTGSTYVLTGLSFLSGLYFPTSLLPAWIRWVSEVQPVSAAVDLLRHLISGLPLQSSVGSDLLRMGLYAVVLTPIAAGMLARSLQFSRRRGTLMEY